MFLVRVALAARTFYFYGGIYYEKSKMVSDVGMPGLVSDCM